MRGPRSFSSIIDNWPIRRPRCRIHVEIGMDFRPNSLGEWVLDAMDVGSRQNEVERRGDPEIHRRGQIRLPRVDQTADRAIELGEADEGLMAGGFSFVSPKRNRKIHS